MIQPLDYFTECEAVATTLTDIKLYISMIKGFAQHHECKVFWRGQSNHAWGLLSSLARKLASFQLLDDKLLNRVEESLLKEAVGWISDLSMAPYREPLAKLAYMQHHGVPTRLLDFSQDPWVAVFFAAESADQTDGRIFAILVDNADVMKRIPHGTPWRKYKTNLVKVWDPTAAGVKFPRLEAQQGVLALGRLPSTRPIRTARDPLAHNERRHLLAEEVRRILSIPFKLSPFTPDSTGQEIPSGAHSPIGLTFRVHVDKESIRRNLAGVGSGRRIAPPSFTATHRSLYPDASGMVNHSPILRGLSKGVLIR